MTTDVKDPVDQAAPASGEPAEKKDVVSYDSFQKVLNEKKKTQEKLSEYEKQLQELREEKLKNEGKKDELLTIKESKIKQLETELNGVKTNYTWSTITGEIKREAIKNGCKDPDKFIRLLDDDDLKSIEIGEGFQVKKESLDAIIDKGKKDNYFLFDSSNKVAATGIPGKSPGKPKSKSESELFEDYIKSLK